MNNQEIIQQIEKQTQEIEKLQATNQKLSKYVLNLHGFVTLLQLLNPTIANECEKAQILPSYEEIIQMTEAIKEKE